MKREDSVIVKNDGKRTRKDKAPGETTFDRIYRFYHSDRKIKIVLTADEEAIRERWEKAWLLLTRHRTRKDVVDLLVKLFNVSQVIAYDDVKHAMMLFGVPNDTVKDAKRAIAEAMAMKGADKSWKEGDMDAYHKFLKIYMNLNHLYDDGASNMADLMKKIRPHQVIIVSSQAELEAQAQAMQKEITKDIPHQEVK